MPVKDIHPKLMMLRLGLDLLKTAEKKAVYSRVSGEISASSPLSESKSLKKDHTSVILSSKDALGARHP